MKYALKLIFLKCIFDFIINTNTAPSASNSVYGREKLFLYDKINFSNHVCHSGAVVNVQINRVRLPAYAVFCFLYRFLFCFCFSSLVSFFSTSFPFGLFFFILTADRAGHALGSIYILSLSPELYFGKGISIALDLHTGQAYDQIKSISPVKTCPSSETAEIFSMLVDIMTNNTQYTTNCTNLHPTPTSDPLAKVKLAFCTSS